ncbi:hypothetical protein [Ornithinimicrobium pratense]|uniref:Uncharacterized protein n=1 Tax=Ornithinimicrobium pratense TaxID=2593973 RepID=A0A5J6V5V9_9MICO|nr:hypothetical protein [Ornithinimicrobium pratense]QFG68402.1 hypothetical protein FY030_06455 [Ornithinimicrobium pratense]
MRSTFITVRDLELRIAEGTLPWTESVRYDTVDLILDGKNLVNWLRPHAEPGIEPPEYLGHPIGTNMTALLLGQCPEDESGRTALLGCTCTVIGCGPLLARIEVGSETVTWSHFERGPGEEYDGLELQFDRDTYMDALTRYEETT